MRLILAIGFAVAALLCWSKAASAADLIGRASIHGQRIRLFGIDAPESRPTCEADGQTYRAGSRRHSPWTPGPDAPRLKQQA